MTATKTDREKCRRDGIISGGWRVFRIGSVERRHLKKRTGNRLVLLSRLSLWEVYFQCRRSSVAPCAEYHKCRAVKRVMSWNCTRPWIINTSFLSALPLNLADLSSLPPLSPHPPSPAHSATITFQLMSEEFLRGIQSRQVKFMCT